MKEEVEWQMGERRVIFKKAIRTGRPLENEITYKQIGPVSQVAGMQQGKKIKSLEGTSINAKGLRGAGQTPAELQPMPLRALVWTALGDGRPL